ncbi:TVP38/TMEM64 family protein [Rossellomorea vietnamensis]|uniref:TVP38/TMEM64 family membrane protein n=1 Tax=Rossellomorea vietnamensis TaxID=218284 RepID=A0A5D4M9T5_9BACI|nr:TVP38/TMEM64 family protein [Rossellomorea vietnamensis]TYR97730.1 TVP38/TMEM64 family protein [Rossellomorea vietnamensis]
MKQLFSLTLSGLIIFIGFTNKDTVLDLIQEGGAIAGFVSILFVAVLVFFPIIPYPVLAGILGSVAGVVNGTLISLIGILIGTTLMFYLSRYGFQSWSQRLLSKYPKAKEYERYFEKNAFLGILFLRILPVIPSPIVNIITGMSRVNFLIFSSATLLGKLPAIVTFTIAGSIFEGNRLLSISIYGVYFLIIVAAASMHFYKKKSSLIIPSEKQVNT